RRLGVLALAAAFVAALACQQDRIVEPTVPASASPLNAFGLDASSSEPAARERTRKMPGADEENLCYVIEKGEQPGSRNQKLSAVKLTDQRLDGARVDTSSGATRPLGTGGTAREPR